MARRTGKTKAMVETLPAGGSVVIVHSHQFGRYVKKMIYDLRGPEVLKKTRVIPVRQPSDTNRLQGIRSPIFVDHAWAELTYRSGCAIETSALIDEYVARSKAYNAKN